MLSHTVFGGMHWLSIVQGPWTMVQRPVEVLQTVPIPQGVLPAWPQPGTHMLFVHTRAGGPHIESIVQELAGGSQRPVMVLHVSPPVHWSPPIGWVQPGMHCPEIQMLEGGWQSVSCEQVVMPVAQRPVLLLQTWPTPQWIGEPAV
jgi:hypothetical protein